jgi:hypothetical protein
MLTLKHHLTDYGVKGVHGRRPPSGHGDPRGTGPHPNLRYVAITGACQDGVVAISYVIGDATEVDGRGPVVIAHVCNGSGGWGKGFVLAISCRWPEPEAAYRRWMKSGGNLDLGIVQLKSFA